MTINQMIIRILGYNLMIINTFKFYCFLSRMPKISAIIILTKVHSQDNFKIRWGLNGLRDCWDYFMIPLRGCFRRDQNPCG